MDKRDKMKPPALERRAFVADELRVATDGDSSRPKIRGHAAVFNSLSLDLGGFREVIAPGAFAASLEQDIRALWNHDTSLPLGRTRAGTLTLEEDAVGLAVEIDPPSSPAGQNAVEAIRRGDVSQMSFGFIVEEESWVRGENGDPDLRTLERINLLEVSPVTFPAYPETDVAVRAWNMAREEWTKRDEALLADQETAIAFELEDEDEADAFEIELGIEEGEETEPEAEAGPEPEAVLEESAPEPEGTPILDAVKLDMILWELDDEASKI